MQKYTKYLLHNNAELLIKEHAEIFGNETIKSKEKDRNSDLSKEYYIRMKQHQYEVISDDISRLEDEKDSLREAKRIADEHNAQRRCKPREQGKKR